ncbi:sporulation protein YpjB [Cytobacillus purgationiresistens]|uniref:Sporulation protein YpjB n=1 Tax=Cytobacillus purgationiresistens TaxID=863449 RepID=A0ABU0AIH3_9BACI|nr:sporulation protein YpjB [Cytobacillus purgationiresistens]MDQ0271063.1 sporulation protein YpjB [Cytobacillus purgationiresistens]
MKVRLLVILLVLACVFPYMANADKNNSSLEKLDQISDEALQMVKLHRYEDAKKLLQYFSDQFVVVTGTNNLLTMDELRVLTASHNEAVQAAASVSMNHDERLNSVIKFRLVMDTLSSSYQPMWTEMKAPVMSVLGNVKESVQAGDRENFHANLNSFLALYDIIYPSLKIDVEPDRMQQLDARVTFIDKYRSQVLEKVESQEELESLDSDLQMIFDEVSEDEADPSLWWVIISTGSIIILTLSYVGWRKYKGDKKKEKKSES